MKLPNLITLAASMLSFAVVSTQGAVASIYQDDLKSGSSNKWFFDSQKNTAKVTDGTLVYNADLTGSTSFKLTSLKPGEKITATFDIRLASIPDDDNSLRVSLLNANGTQLKNTEGDDNLYRPFRGYTALYRLGNNKVRFRQRIAASKGDLTGTSKSWSPEFDDQENQRGRGSLDKNTFYTCTFSIERTGNNSLRLLTHLSPTGASASSNSYIRWQEITANFGSESEMTTAFDTLAIGGRNGTSPIIKNITVTHSTK
jgi:hypothetical protein